MDSRSRFFISHSSRDTAIALALHGRLESADVWVDTYEIDVGDILLEEISAGIEQATDFVLLWSANSAQSSWVRFEFHMAFIRWLEDNATALRIVCLDDTPMRLYQRPFLQYRGNDIDEMVTRLMQAPPKAPMPRPFIDRNDTLTQIESAYYATETSSTWLVGVSGVGKRTAVREALKRFRKPDRNLRIVRVGPGTGEVELLLQLLAVLGEFDPDEPKRWAPLEALERVGSIVQEFTASNGLWVFEDAQYWLTDDSTPSGLLQVILDAVARAGAQQPGNLALLTSTRRPDLRYMDSSAYHVIQLSGLATEYGVALLRSHGATAPEATLIRASAQLAGHPLALEVVAEKLNAPDVDWSAERVRQATAILANIALSERTRLLLEVLATVDGPMPVQELAEHISADSDGADAAIAEAVSYSLVVKDDHGYLGVHPLVKDYYRQIFRNRDDYAGRLDDLASRSKRVLHEREAGTPRYIDSLISTYWLLGLANRMDEARSLRSDLHGTIYAVALELYRREQYRDALTYFEQVDANGVNGLSAQLYIARCLAYLRKIAEARRMLDTMLVADSSNPQIVRVRGRVEYIVGRWADAIRFYEAARSIQPRYVPVLLDLGQTRIRIGDWHGARRVLEDAIARGDLTSYGLNLYSQVLEHDRELSEALNYIRQAARLEPNNAAFQHRMGVILQKLGDLAGARDHLREAVRLDRTYAEAWLSLASVLVDLKLPAEALDVLVRAAKMSRVRPTVISNIRAKALLAQGDMLEARSWIDRALADAPDEPENIGLAAHIELTGIEAGGLERATALDRLARLISRMDDIGEHEQAKALRQAVARL